MNARSIDRLSFSSAIGMGLGVSTGHPMGTIPILASMLEHSTVIVGISNPFWIDHTTIPRYEATALRGWAKLFHLPYFLAVNS
jgi:hypothetical protein